MDKIERNEAYTKYGYKPQHLCIKPFCFSNRLPGQLGLCCNCLRDLENMIGIREIYDCSRQEPMFKITPKEALELLLQHKRGGISDIFRIENEPCMYCESRLRNSNPQKAQKLNVQQSEKKA